MAWEDRIRKKDLVLDIGCWSGNRVKDLLGKCEPYGLDIDEGKLNLASPKLRKRLFLGDITKKSNLRKLNKKFDWIFLGEVLEHIKEDELVLKNSNSLLKKKGKIVITTPKSIPFLEFWDPAWVIWKLHIGQRHYHYSKNELYQKLEKSGFYVEEIKVVGTMKWLFFRWVNAILKKTINLRVCPTYEKKAGFFDWEILAVKK